MTAYGKDDPMSKLLAARSLKCHFGQGVETTWPNGKPKTTTAHAGTDLDVNFDSIDILNQSARMIGNIGASDVKVSATQVGVSFVQSAPSVVDLTTVFPIYGNNHNFIAVDTRHVMIPGAAMAEQFYGSCQVLQ
ncbi:MAG: hypothetical protein PHR71_04735 [Polaromonas sp.]|nr:hypothetical protein [Polaromonas sp.]